jgi:hypothetical protein
MKRQTKCRTHVQREARRVLLEITRSQRCLARCLARVDEVKATEAEVRKIRQQLDLVGRMIKAFNAAKSDLELSAAMQLVIRLTAFEEVPSIRPDHRDRARPSASARQQTPSSEGVLAGVATFADVHDGRDPSVRIRDHQLHAAHRVSKRRHFALNGSASEGPTTNPSTSRRTTVLG